MRSYQEWHRRAEAQHGSRLSVAGLDSRFVRYFESGERIRVRCMGAVITGTVGVTCGWFPVFLLIRTARSSGSSWTLGSRDEVLAVKRGRKYQTVTINPKGDQ